MYFFRILLATLAAFLGTSLHVAASPVTENRAINQAVYDNLLLYTRYSAASYGLICLRPLGNTLVERVQNRRTGTDGMVVRDDQKEEIVVVFRGTEITSIIDILTDLRFHLTPLDSPGITEVGSARVHSGFLDGYNSVATNLLRIVQQEVTSHPSYRIVVTGHSLGGAVASLAAISIRAALPDTPMQLYTFGQPRTGDVAFSEYVEQQIGTDNIFRAVHTRDGVPGLPPRFIGYSHFATEYWNFRELPSAANTRQCVGREDPTCSASNFFAGVNIPHTIYFGQLMVATPSLCL